MDVRTRPNNCFGTLVRYLIGPVHGPRSSGPDGLVRSELVLNELENKRFDFFSDRTVPDQFRIGGPINNDLNDKDRI